ncbi:MAG: hypothetical protein ACLTWE_05080 [Dysgonomonas mossii]|uniref:hypothetical protein n=1 Tax=Dysgonomonas TaxID=156973 RepID=UPI00208E5397|nr:MULTISPECIES: hypothetical protein [Dysgonomonas]
MLLFNVSKGNKGKKYFSKKRDMSDIVFAEKAEAFNRWFADNNKKLTQYLEVRRSYNCDVFNDSYLKMYENILFSGNKIENYMHYFIRSYYTNLMAEGIKQNRYCELLPNYDKSDVDSGYFREIEAKQSKLESDIMQYVYDNYDIRDFELFKMYISLKPAINYSSLSEITGVKAHNIQRAISRIKKGVLANKEFAERRRELV